MAAKSVDNSVSAPACLSASSWPVRSHKHAFRFASAEDVQRLPCQSASYIYLSERRNLLAKVLFACLDRCDAFRWSGGDQLGEVHSLADNLEPLGIGNMMVKHISSGSCRGGPLDGQSLEYHQNVYVSSSRHRMNC